MGDSGSGDIYEQVDGRFWKWRYLRTGIWASPDVAVLFIKCQWI